jgi:excisionase family DNA binding protein
MSQQLNSFDSGDHACDAHSRSRSGRITVEEIAGRLDIGRLAVYSMLERGILPGIRLGRRWIITRHAYEQWERTCGTRSGAGLRAQPEVTVLN